VFVGFLVLFFNELYTFSENIFTDPVRRVYKRLHKEVGLYNYFGMINKRISMFRHIWYTYH